MTDLRNEQSEESNVIEFSEVGEMGTEAETVSEPSDIDDQELNSESSDTEQSSTANAIKSKRRRRRRKNVASAEKRLSGRKSLCQSIAQIAPKMLKRDMLRILGSFIDSTRGMDENDLTQRMIKEAKNIGAKKRVLTAFHNIDENLDRRNLKEIILIVVLLQEETYALEESKLEEKVIAYEKRLIAESKNIDLFDEKKHDAARVKSCETYKIVLEAAWENDGVSIDEANLLRTLRSRLGISAEDHRLISAALGKFPKDKRQIHSLEEIHDARKELQREGLLWCYRDEKSNIDVIPSEVALVLRSESLLNIQLQKVNFSRLLQHNFITVSDLTEILKKFSMDPYGKKNELIDRVAGSDIKPTEVLEVLDRSKLSDMCRSLELKSSGVKGELIERLIEFYDDLSFEEKTTEDVREDWFNNYELLASRSYADLRAKKVISKDLDVEHQFEKATDYLFEEVLNLKIDNSRKTSKADGRIELQDHQVILWDCKSCEKEVNLQDYLESQFEDYLVLERKKGKIPLAFLVIGPAFTESSIKLAHKFKAKTNWDVALVQADALKLLAESWDSNDIEKPFPIQLLNRTELIDKDRAEFLLTLD